eukprot:gene13636-16116_t
MEPLVYYNSGKERYHLRCFPHTARVQYLTLETLEPPEMVETDAKFQIEEYFASDGRGYAYTSPGARLCQISQTQKRATKTWYWRPGACSGQLPQYEQPGGYTLSQQDLHALAACRWWQYKEHRALQGWRHFMQMHVEDMELAAAVRRKFQLRQALHEWKEFARDSGATRFVVHRMVHFHKICAFDTWCDYLQYCRRHRRELVQQ